MSAYSDFKLAEQYEEVAGMLIDNARLWDAPGTMNAPATASALNAAARELRARAKELRTEPRTFSRITTREGETAARHEAMKFMLDFKASCADRTPGVRETMRAADDAKLGPVWLIKETRLQVWPDAQDEQTPAAA